MLLIKVWNLPQHLAREDIRGRNILNSLAFSLQGQFANESQIGPIGIVFPQDMLPTNSLETAFVEVLMARKAARSDAEIDNDVAEIVGRVIKHELSGMNVICVVRNVAKGDGYWESS